MNELMQCCSCKHQWRDLPGGWGASFAGGCPECGSLYWQWTTYKDGARPCPRITCI